MRKVENISRRWEEAGSDDSICHVTRRQQEYVERTVKELVLPGIR